MTINYTTLLGLAKPVTGTETGQWGDVVNNEITSLLEDAVANAATFSVTSGNVTLSTTNGTSNQARMSTLIITGTPGTTRNVIAPSQAKVYQVINQSDSSVVIKGAATTGVTIPAGATGTVAWNGSDFVEVNSTSSGRIIKGNLQVTGNLQVDGNTQLGNSTSDTLAVTALVNSNLLFTDATYDIGASGATRPRNLYLSGLLTMGGALTVNGDSTLGDASGDSLTINAGTTTFVQGTANGVAYLNGSKVLTTGSALTFDGTNYLNVTGLRIGGSDTTNTIYQATGALALSTGSTSPITFNVNLSEGMRLTSTGLGIGTTNPSAKIHASGTTTLLDSNGQIFAGVTDAVAANKGGQIMMGGYYTGTTTTSFGGFAAKKENSTDGNYAGYLQFLVSAQGLGNTERARIDSSGNLLVGTASAPTGSLTGANIRCGSMFANTGSTVGGEAAVINAIHSGGDYFGIMLKNNSTTASTAITFVNSSNTRVGSVGVTTTATSYNTSSDYRLKEDIAPMTGALAKVAALKPCTYKWKADGSDGEGFIAHELAEVVPQCVTGEKDAVDEDGNPVYQGIDTSFLVATLTAAIQEQQAIIEQLKADVTALKGAA